jgi:hypothetical protein
MKTRWIKLVSLAVAIAIISTAFSNVSVVSAQDNNGRLRLARVVLDALSTAAEQATGMTRQDILKEMADNDQTLAPKY